MIEGSMSNWVVFLFFTCLAILVQALFALFEMASVSFSRIRLQYYVSIGKKSAIWLSSFLQHPSRFFGTTLIGINTALQVGSECSRRFYESIHLDPDFAPISQVLLVVIFAELAPMFAARRHPSQIALTLVPLMRFLASVFLPVIWAFDFLSRGIHRLMGTSKETPLFFSREEVTLAFEEGAGGYDELHELTRRIFHMKNQSAGQMMIPLEKLVSVPSFATLEEVRNLLSIHYEPVVAIYRHQKHNIIALAHTRDLLRLERGKPILDQSRSPWFITRESSILHILDQFRRNNQSAAVVLDPSGHACGLLTLDHIVSQIFGEESLEHQETPSSLYVERTLLGEMTVGQFNREFQSDLRASSEDTLSDFIVHGLGHFPNIGETFKVGSFLFTVIEPTLRGVKVLSVQSLND